MQNIPDFLLARKMDQVTQSLPDMPQHIVSGYMNVGPAIVGHQELILWSAEVRRFGVYYASC